MFIQTQKYVRDTDRQTDNYDKQTDIERYRTEIKINCMKREDRKMSFIHVM